MDDNPTVEMDESAEETVKIDENQADKVNLEETPNGVENIKCEDSNSGEIAETDEQLNESEITQVSSRMF